jgi:FkbM family methyltransferase
VTSVRRRLLSVLNVMVLHRLGLRLQRFNDAALLWERDSGLGRDLKSDLVSFIEQSGPVVFDVGAHRGQSIRAFRHMWPDSTITSFEPDPLLARRLRNAWRGVPGVDIVESAVLDSDAIVSLFQFESSDLNSVLDRSPGSWIREDFKTGEVAVQSLTLDGYCSDNKVERIDYLKVDVQGAELQVLQGAEGLLSNRAIKYVLLELTFYDLYDGGARPSEVFASMESAGYRFVAMYNQTIGDSRLKWADALWSSD